MHINIHDHIKVNGARVFYTHPYLILQTCSYVTLNLCFKYNYDITLVQYGQEDEEMFLLVTIEY